MNSGREHCCWPFFFFFFFFNPLSKSVLLVFRALRGQPDPTPLHFSEGRVPREPTSRRSETTPSPYIPRPPDQAECPTACSRGYPNSQSHGSSSARSGLSTCWRWPAEVQRERQNGEVGETEATVGVVEVVVGDQAGCWSAWVIHHRSTDSSTTSHPPLGSLGAFTQLICTLQLWSMTCPCLQMMLFDKHCKGWAGDDCSHRYLHSRFDYCSNLFFPFFPLSPPFFLVHI